MLFFFANYLAHCASVKKYPGEKLVELILAMVLALLFPSSGISRALDSIFRLSRFAGKDKLQCAARAGALCMVVRTKEWKPEVGNVIRDVEIQPGRDVGGELKKLGTSEGTQTLFVRVSDESKLCVEDPKWIRDLYSITVYEYLGTGNDRTVHGSYELPDGYELRCAPSDIEVEPCSDPQIGSNSTPNASSNSSSKTPMIAYSNSVTKCAVAIAQTVYAAITLYRTRGNQIRVYGYAAFGLTVTPYIIMSLLNLLGQLITPEYPTRFLIHTPEMDEAIQRHGCHFNGIVGKVKNPKKPSPNSISLTIETSENGTSSLILKASVEASSSESVDLPHKEDSKTPSTTSKSWTKDNPIDISNGDIFRIPSCSRFDCKTKCGKVDDTWSSSQLCWYKFLVLFGIPLMFSCVSLLIIGLLSHFEKGESTLAQRAWIMSWLVCGMVFGMYGIGSAELILSAYQKAKRLWAAQERKNSSGDQNPSGDQESKKSADQERKNSSTDPKAESRTTTWKSNFSSLHQKAQGVMLISSMFVVLVGFVAVPAIGGFVVVFKMISHDGTCTRL